MIIMIAAAAENNALGKDNQLLWHLPDDFKRFRELTTGHPIIMGRKTFESFPKPLPNRQHFIITRDKNYQVNHPSCLVVNSLEEALAAVAQNQDSYIIGGGEIYKLALPHTDKIELTRVFDRFDGDAFFPEIDPEDWQLAEEIFHPKDEKHAVAFAYQTYFRR